MAPKQTGRQNCACSLTNLQKNLLLVFCGLEKGRTRLRKKKKENDENNMGLSPTPFHPLSPLHTLKVSYFFCAYYCIESWRGAQ